MTNVRFKWADQESVIDVNSVMFAEARAIEKVTGLTFKETMEQLANGSMEAVQAFVWIAFRRHNPGMKFSDLDEVPLTSVEVSQDESDGAADVQDPNQAVPVGSLDGANL